MHQKAGSDGKIKLKMRVIKENAEKLHLNLRIVGI